MASYSKRLVKKITDLIKTDNYTIAEICEIVKISERCYYDWQKNNAEFADAIACAKFGFDQIIAKEAKNSLRKKVNGYDVEESKTVYIDSGKLDENGNPKPKIKERTVIKKHFQPDTEAIKVVLFNKTDGEYANRQSTELTGKGGKDLFGSLSDDDLDKRIAELEKKLKQ